MMPQGRREKEKEKVYVRFAMRPSWKRHNFSAPHHARRRGKKLATRCDHCGIFPF